LKISNSLIGGYLILDPIILVTEEAVSALFCFILVWFMAKPFYATRENRYLGLPLGFGFLGASYALSAIAHITPFSVTALTWLQLLARPFAFLFLTFTYYFSKKPTKNSRIIWDIILSILLVTLTVLAILTFVAPQFNISNYRVVGIYVRIIDIVCLVYISVHTLRSHLESKDPSNTILTPIAFMLLGVSQYSILAWAVDGGMFAFYGGIIIRLTSLVIFLVIAYRIFYRQEGSR
jgi:hypothetical protein